jgi:hypothetical protein
MINQFVLAPEAKEPVCNVDGVITEFPENVFRLGVYQKFCEEVSRAQDKELTGMVDSRGNQIPNREKFVSRTDRRVHVGIRSPPPNPDTWKDYRIQLRWQPGQATDTCADSCAEAMVSIANSPCKFFYSTRSLPITLPGCVFINRQTRAGGHTGRQSNTMTQDISYDVGCGTYSVFVDSPPEPPPQDPYWPQDQKCHERFPYEPPVTVDSEEQARRAKEFCDSLSTRVIKADEDEGMELQLFGNLGFQVLWYNRKWSPLRPCTLYKEQSVAKPLPHDDTVTCYKLMRENYENCKSYDSYSLMFNSNKALCLR